MLDKIFADMDSNVELKMMLDTVQSIHIQINNDNRLKNFVIIKKRHVDMVSIVEISKMLITVIGTRIRESNCKTMASISII
jgi:hypothetical protein